MIVNEAIYGHHEAMKTVNVSQLKARLSAYLADVRRGEAVLVCDRSTPIARIVPIETAHDALQIREPTKPKSALRNIRPVKLRGDVDIVAVLREDRDSR